jgi:hypothetical protein
MARQTVYIVQPYVGARGRLVEGVLREYGDEGRARQAGAALSAKRAGVLVLAVSCEPDFDQWDEPRVLAAYGETPRRVA